MEILNEIGQILDQVRINKPLVHHITNYVTVNDCANITLAIGGSPIMADDIAEMEDMVKISNALVINIGTLNKRTIKSMLVAGKQANKRGIPVILDPVGVGASSFRQQAVKQICRQIKLAVVRGNASEITFMAGQESSGRGVDAQKGLTQSEQCARELAKGLGCVVAMTGEVDIVTNGIDVVSIKDGNELMESITGTGCMCTSLVAAFCGVTSQYFEAAVGGVACMSLAGDIAFVVLGEKKGTSSYRQAIVDTISYMNRDTLMQVSIC